ncbi:MAG: hypothetical protein KUG77_28995, partial [Nannocystaceae bacterium]|nr:hypothetical protein [Nannocystaceae bacterium]
WLAIPQSGGSTVTTDNGGDAWVIPTGIEGLEHPHGNAQIFQDAASIFVAGIGGPQSGMYRSTDWGESFTHVQGGNLGIAWGTENAVYTMWGWACAGCDLGASFQHSPLSGDDWTAEAVPKEMNIGANHIAVTSDGTHNIFVGTMWSTGVWRYIEPTG